MSDRVTSDTPPSDGDESGTKRKPRYDWEDPTIPIGNAPSMPRWPAVVFAVGWVGWLAFLLAMLLSCNPAAEAV